MKILLLEDDIILHESIQEYLEFEEWLVLVPTLQMMFIT